MEQYIQRHYLPHHVPDWIRPEENIYFITMCCSERYKNQLCYDTIAEKIFESIRYYQDKKIWFSYLVLLMPDHLHGIFSFSKEESIKGRLIRWKHYLSQNYKIRFQRDFFEHRIRLQEWNIAKVEYILQNPVRAGLVDSPNNWPYIYRGDSNRKKLQQEIDR